MEEGKKAVLDTTLAKGELYKVLKADKRGWVVVCWDSAYFFRVRLSDQVELASITISREHTCGPETHQNWQQAGSVKVLAARHRESVVDNRKINPKHLVNVCRIVIQ